MSAHKLRRGQRRSEDINSLDWVQVADPGDPAKHVLSRDGESGVEDEHENDQGGCVRKSWKGG
jgi:hypothetical protein